LFGGPRPTPALAGSSLDDAGKAPLRLGALG